ncbi:MAG: 50S ribosomal protein L11 methyltransferase [Bdellovibrionia bacterium]
MAAARLGATSVDAVDIDAEAVEVARENVERNGIGIRFFRKNKFFLREFGLKILWRKFHLDQFSGASSTVIVAPVAGALSPSPTFSASIFGL